MLLLLLPWLWLLFDAAPREPGGGDGLKGCALASREVKRLLGVAPGPILPPMLFASEARLTGLVLNRDGVRPKDRPPPAGPLCAFAPPIIIALDGLALLRLGRPPPIIIAALPLLLLPLLRLLFRLTLPVSGIPMPPREAAMAGAGLLRLPMAAEALLATPGDGGITGETIPGCIDAVELLPPPTPSSSGWCVELPVMDPPLLWWLPPLPFAVAALALRLLPVAMPIFGCVEKTGVVLAAVLGGVVEVWRAVNGSVPKAVSPPLCVASDGMPPPALLSPLLRLYMPEGTVCCCCCC